MMKNQWQVAWIRLFARSSHVQELAWPGCQDLSIHGYQWEALAAAA